MVQLKYHTIFGDLNLKYQAVQMYDRESLNKFITRLKHGYYSKLMSGGACPSIYLLSRAGSGVQYVVSKDRDD